MSRTSAFQPEFGMETFTLCQPTEISVLMGVTLPVSFPSIDTFAPDGNELTFNLPCLPCAPALLGSRSRLPTNRNRKIRTILRCWAIQSSLSASHALCTRQLDLPRVMAGFEGTWLCSSQLPLHALDAPKPFVFNDKEEIFPGRSRVPV
jgi:hypothetical protein